jgi:hypothetical protein
MQTIPLHLVALNKADCFRFYKKSGAYLNTGLLIQSFIIIMVILVVFTSFNFVSLKDISEHVLSPLLS